MKHIRHVQHSTSCTVCRRRDMYIGSDKTWEASMRCEPGTCHMLRACGKAMACASPFHLSVTDRQSIGGYLRICITFGVRRLTDSSINSWKHHITNVLEGSPAAQRRAPRCAGTGQSSAPQFRGRCPGMRRATAERAAPPAGAAPAAGPPAPLAPPSVHGTPRSCASACPPPACWSKPSTHTRVYEGPFHNLTDPGSVHELVVPLCWTDKL